MYIEHFGLKEPPFRITPDPRFLFLGPAHREALATLVYGIREGKGLVSVTGGIGTGKTTILNELEDRIGDECLLVRLADPKAQFEAILGELLDAVGVDAAGLDRSARLTRLGKVLKERAKKGETRPLVLVVDEAQDILEDVLEDLRLLTNLETHDRKLIQICLVGQPEFRDRLEAPGFAALRQRIALASRIEALERAETEAYVRHRIEVAGGDPDAIFDAGSLEEIHVYARGVPRLINVLSDGALSICYGSGASNVTSAMVREVIRDLDGEGHGFRRGPRAGGGERIQAALRSPIGIGALGVAMGLLVLALIRPGEGPGPDRPVARAEAATEAMPVAPPAPVAPSTPAPVAPPAAAAPAPAPTPSSPALVEAAPPAGASPDTAPASPPVEGAGDPGSELAGLEVELGSGLGSGLGTSLGTGLGRLGDEEIGDFGFEVGGLGDPVDPGADPLDPLADPLEPVGSSDVALLAAAKTAELESRLLAEVEQREAVEEELAFVQRRLDKMVDELVDAQDEVDRMRDRERRVERPAPAPVTRSPIVPGSSSVIAPARPSIPRAVPTAPIASEETEVKPVRIRDLYVSRAPNVFELSPVFRPGDQVHLSVLYETDVPPSWLGSPMQIDFKVTDPARLDVPGLGLHHERTVKNGTFQANATRRIPGDAAPGIYGLIATFRVQGFQTYRVFLFRVS